MAGSGHEEHDAGRSPAHFAILTYGTTVHAGRRSSPGPALNRAASYGDLGRDCARLANALRALGVDGDQRVATFMWNNEEHLGPTSPHRAWAPSCTP